MNDAPTLILASQSPRRAQLLMEAGFVFEQRSPPFADPDQPPGHLRGHEAERYAAALAEQKAISLAIAIDAPALILAADTICVDDRGELIGKPRDQQHARAMMRSFVDAEHRVITGVALLQVLSDTPREAHAASVWASGACDTGGGLESFADAATVRFGSITDAQLDDYLSTDDWRGKAGGYNLFDRQAAGWPIEVIGAPTTLVGLPMARLAGLLRSSLHSG